MSKTIITNPSRRYQKLLDLAREGSHPYVYLLGLRSYRTPELLEKIGDGLSFAAFKRLQRHMGLPSQELARIVQIHDRTLEEKVDYLLREVEIVKEAMKSVQRWAESEGMHRE